VWIVAIDGAATSDGSDAFTICRPGPRHETTTLRD